MEKKKPTTIVRRLCIRVNTRARWIDLFYLIFRVMQITFIFDTSAFSPQHPSPDFHSFNSSSTHNIRYIHISVRSTDPQQLYDKHAVY